MNINWGPNIDRVDRIGLGTPGIGFNKDPDVGVQQFNAALGPGIGCEGLGCSFSAAVVRSTSSWDCVEICCAVFFTILGIVRVEETDAAIAIQRGRQGAEVMCRTVSTVTEFGTFSA